MGEVLKIFISATTADLGEVRRAARAALEANSYFKPIEQAHFGPAAETLGAGDRRRLAECDAVLHIVGECYGHEPPPCARPRRSYTQLEHDDARALKKPLYLFVCADGFPYTAHDPEPADRRALQAAHRTTILNGHDKYDLIADLPAFQQKIREIDLPLQRLLTRKARTRRLTIAAVSLAALVLVLFGAYLLRTAFRTPEATAGAAREAVKEEMRAAEKFDPARIKANLQRDINARAAAEIAQLDPVRDWEKVAELEKSRDQQLGDVDRAVDQIGQVFKKKEASANYAIATQLLAREGAAETLRFLDSKSDAREMKIAALKGDVELTEHVLAAQKDQLREPMREKLLAADLREKELQFDQAEAIYREVIRDGGAWIEPRNRLAELLYKRGIVIEPATGNAKLREAADLCRGTLAVNSQEADLKAWILAQNGLGVALKELGERAEGSEGERLREDAVAAFRSALAVNTREKLPEEWARTQRYLGNALLSQGERRWDLGLLGEAVTAHRAALEVYTRAQWPWDWAATQNSLGNAVRAQGQRVPPSQSVRLLNDAVTTYRAALEVRTRERWPQDWAMTQNNLGNALSDQGMRTEGAERLRLLGEAVTAYRAALAIYTREQSPPSWARTQYNLGLALSSQGMHAEGAESQRFLREAVTAARAALEVYTREQVPYYWKHAKGNLAESLRALARRSTGAEAARLRAEAEGIDKDLAEP